MDSRFELNEFAVEIANATLAAHFNQK